MLGRNALTLPLPLGAPAARGILSLEPLLCMVLGRSGGASMRNRFASPVPVRTSPEAVRAWPFLALSEPDVEPVGVAETERSGVIWSAAVISDVMAVWSEGLPATL